MTDPFVSLNANGKSRHPNELRLSGIGVPPQFDPTRQYPLATPNDAALADCTPGAEASGGPLLESALPPAFPDAPAMLGALDLETPSPLAEFHFNPLPSSLEAILPSVTQQTSAAAALVARHGMRLPSFEALGIAAPLPGRKPVTPGDGLLVGAGPLSMPGDPLHELDPERQLAATAGRRSSYIGGSPLPSADATQRSITHYIPTLTPPDETARARWPDQFPSVTSAAMQSPAHSDPERTTPRADNVGEAEAPPTLQQTIPVAGPIVSSKDGLGEQWIEGALQTLCE